MGGLFCRQSGEYTVNAEPTTNGSTSCPVFNKMCPTRYYTVPKAIPPSPTDREKKGTITTSWRKFMGNAYENSMNVFLLSLEEHPEYKEKFKIVEKDYDEIRLDIRIRKHTLAMVDYMKKLVDNMENIPKLDSIILEIEEYYKKMEVTSAAIVDYKDCMIKYMHESGYITEKGVNYWHSFLDETIDKLKKETHKAPS